MKTVELNIKFDITEDQYSKMEAEPRVQGDTLLCYLNKEFQAAGIHEIGSNGVIRVKIKDKK
mgnify:CR=1 FL=1